MGFSRFELSPSLFQAITSLGYAEPTPVQAMAIPEALLGRDIRACAQTGTGKTCAFVIPIIDKFTKEKPAYRPAALIVTPTRELASQVFSVVQGLTKGSTIKSALLLGGVGMHGQFHQLRMNPEIVVATPGRLMDHVTRGSMSLGNIKILVLDEADRMLDMGFLPDIKRILARIPQERQTMLFSATFGNEIKALTNQFLRNPAVVDVSPSTTSASSNVTQMVYPVSYPQKKALLQAILELGSMTSALIFSRTKHGADRLLITLKDWGKKAAVIHSNRSQSQRQQALAGFKSGYYQILVATDIAARGIDFKDISHVINFDVPQHPEDYVHRIGRTGRAQAVGEAFTLVAPDEEAYVRRIENFIKKPIPRGVIPDFPYQAQPKMFNNKQAQQHGQHHRPHHKPAQHSQHHHGPQRSNQKPSQHSFQQHSQQRPNQKPTQHSQHPQQRQNPKPGQPSHSQPPQGQQGHPHKKGNQPGQNPPSKKRFDWRNRRSH